MDRGERLVQLRSWRVASEIVAEHPELTVVEIHPGGGQNDCLSIVPEHGSDGLEIRLNRSGTLGARCRPAEAPVVDPRDAAQLGELLAAQGMDVRFSWEEELREPDPSRIPRILAGLAGLPARPERPEPTPRVVALQMIHRLLLLGLEDSVSWDARSARYDSSGGDGGRGPDRLERFPSVQEAVARDLRAGFKGEALYDYWVIEMDAVPRAVIGIDGTLHRSLHSVPLDLMVRYEALGGSVDLIAESVRERIFDRWS